MARDEADDDEPPRQRRRMEAADNDAPTSSSRANRLAALAARRRQRRMDLQQEVLQLAGDTSETAAAATPSFHARNRPHDDLDDAVGTDDDDDEYNQVSPSRGVGVNDDEDEEGEDLIENAERDYQRIAALDTYGTEGMDDAEYDRIDPQAREAAEREIARRRQNRGDTLYGRMWEEEGGEDEDARQARRSMFGRRAADGGDGDDGDPEDDEEDEEEDLDGEDPFNLEAFDVPLREWIAQDQTRREIQRRFRAFLRHFVPTTDGGMDARQRRRGNGIYEQSIKTMCATNKNTLEVSYTHLVDSEPILAYWLADAPRDMLHILNEAATRHTVSIFPLYVANAIAREIHVRIKDVPLADTLRDLRRHHLDGLVKVPGVVTRRSAVYPVLQQAYYLCSSCQHTQGPFDASDDGMGSGAAAAGDANGAELHRPDQCPRCEGTAIKMHPTRCIYRNMQRLYLQEAPGSVPPGRVPRSKEVIVTDDLIDSARPGEEIEVTGIYRHSFDTHLTVKSGFPVFSTWIYANYIYKRSGDSSSNAANLSEADIRQILELSRDPRIAERIVQSIAPSIYGQEFPKTALAMSLFGGVPKNDTGAGSGNNQHHRIRGDVNVLLLGDPGTAKSQLLKYAQHTAPRAVYSTGKGASAVGLTASVHKDPITREWTLEGGALVLADRGT
jgi:DNA replication licensing factor MCM2